MFGLGHVVRKSQVKVVLPRGSVERLNFLVCLKHNVCRSTSVKIDSRWTALDSHLIDFQKLLPGSPVPLYYPS